MSRGKIVMPNELGKKIHIARKKAGYTLAKLSELVGTSSGHLSDIENDKRSPGGELLIALAKTLDISIDGIANVVGIGRPTDGFDIPQSARRIPIISWAQAGTDGFFEDSHFVGSGFADINCPHDVTDPNAYALIISGDSMSPKYDPGDIVVVSPAAGVQTGDFAIVRLVDGQVLAKKIKEKNGSFILLSINNDFPELTVPRENVISLHRIVWVKQRG
jgi:phage repressor protein C with HTH and peptisase S24 domain